MIYHFDEFALDTGTLELRRHDQVVPVEPQVFALLLLLVSNAERVVSRDEIVEKVWENRVVSDAAISSRIKSCRRALGDDGRTQRYIRTTYGAGVRFVGEAVLRASPQVSAPAGLDLSGRHDSRPSIAVLPFQVVGPPGSLAALPEALPHELIVELSRLRWLFVIARGSSFRFRAPVADVGHVGRVLGVRYCVSGIVETAGPKVCVVVEVVDTGDAHVVWADRYEGSPDDIHEIRRRIVSGVAASLEVRIPLVEAERARLASPASLDAWSSYHVGLQHMFRFNRTDNAAAASMFERAVSLEPGFARAHAGLSFTHFQDAFLNYSGTRVSEAQAARRHAERSVELDALDPFANFTMGRSLWLESDLDGSVAWLDRATTLSPSYAQGIYARAWADTVSCRGEEGQRNADLAMSLSPLDPLFYGMLGARALSHVVRGQYAEAADWAERAVRSPGAHAMIEAIAVIAHTLHGDRARALARAGRARERAPGLGKAEFFRSFPFPEGDVRRRVDTALSECGF